MSTLYTSALAVEGAARTTKGGTVDIDLRHVERAVDAARALTARVATVVGAAERRLAGAQFVGTSDGGLVMAHADHRARVARIEIAPTGLTRVPATELAHQVVQAVGRARELATAEYALALRTAA